MDLFADMRDSSSLLEEEPQRIVKSWKVLLVDDDQEMHQVTQLALSGFRFQQRPLDP